jgi:hypothetical protein
MINESRPIYLIEDRLHGHAFSSDAPHNTGLMVIGDPDTSAANRTVVVAGMPRGGTTMVAECLVNLGLPMGVPTPAPYNFEDPEFQDLLHLENPGPLDQPRLESLIERRNAANPVWGFKFPLAINSLGILERALRNPQFILVFRDVAAAAAREVISAGMGATYAMRRGLVLQQRMIDFAESSRAPCMLLSYEKALQFPDVFVNLLVSWCAWPASTEQTKRAYATVVANRQPYVSDTEKDGLRRIRVGS